MELCPFRDGENDSARCNLSGGLHRLRGPDLGTRRPVRPPHGGQPMNVSEAIGLTLTVGLMAYLTVALLKPEWFP